MEQPEIYNNLFKLLSHIKEVQLDVIENSHSCNQTISTFISNKSIEVDDETMAALQYQDILSQQLNAVVESIDAILVNIQSFKHMYTEDSKLIVENIDKLNDKVNKVLDEAKRKREAFKGNSLDEESGDVEFF